MQATSTSPTPTAGTTQPGLPPRIDSTQLLCGNKTVEIEHGGQRYTLRVTKDDKLILTK